MLELESGSGAGGTWPEGRFLRQHSVDQVRDARRFFWSRPSGRSRDRRDLGFFGGSRIGHCFDRDRLLWSVSAEVFGQHWRQKFRQNCGIGNPVSFGRENRRLFVAVVRSNSCNGKRSRELARFKLHRLISLAGRAQYTDTPIKSTHVIPLAGIRKKVKG